MRAGNRCDPTLARASAIVRQSGAAAIGRAAMDAAASAFATSVLAAQTRRFVEPLTALRPGRRRTSVLAIAIAAAAVHVVTAAALPPTAAPTIPITAATLVAAVVAVGAR